MTADTKPTAPPLRAAILIIGWLFWDAKASRQVWRSARLQLTQQQLVLAPIRYARRARSRNCYVYHDLCRARPSGNRYLGALYAGSRFDIILATATKPTTKHPPSAEEIADAWVGAGGEDYFFNNIAAGIRTPDDLAVWRRIEQEQPDWLTTAQATYADAVKRLREKTAATRAVA